MPVRRSQDGGDSQSESVRCGLEDRTDRLLGVLKAPDSGAFSVVETKRIELSTPALQKQRGIPTGLSAAGNTGVSAGIRGTFGPAGPLFMDRLMDRREDQPSAPGTD